MQLKELKLSGFKSFVEPTVVPFPSQLVAVVGPNGCGKSNIIDAVRWVMGESSAKNLRGEAMTDVIFNGSSQRKPVGQASVEIIFDNSLGRLTGQYASYREISIKRVVTRDGDSNYFLNNTRCRRRDITDIFLGTGAGSRGYAIIGQDMISRLIEARPDDLKAYLEEAAGISRYKDRRRETLQRINQTRENLDRVSDIREELAKQLARLERQAKAAERYKGLKEKEKQLRGRILSTKWMNLSQKQAIIAKTIYELNFTLEEYETTQNLLANEEVLLQEELHKANALFQVTQTQFYNLGTEIARLEESLQQQQRERQLLQKNSEELEEEYQITQKKLDSDRAMLTDCEHSLETTKSTLDRLNNAFRDQKKQLEDQEQKASDWNKEWQDINNTYNKIVREKQTSELGLKSLQAQRQQTLAHVETLVQDQCTLQTESILTELKTLEEEKERIAQIEIDYTTKLEKTYAHSKSLQSQMSENELNINSAADKITELSTQQAALTVAQRTAMHKVNDPEKLKNWANNPRMVTALNVDEKWVKASELVLGETLQAILIDDLEPFLSQLGNVEDAAFFVTARDWNKKEGYTRLLDKVHGVIPSMAGISNVFTAENLDEAQKMLSVLQENESVVTPQGIWLGKGWVRVAVNEKENLGLLERQQSLIKVNAELETIKDHLTQLQIKRDRLKGEFEQNKDIEEELGRELQKLQANALSISSQLSNKKQTLDHISLRLLRLKDEKEEKEYLLEGMDIEIVGLTQTFEEAEKQSVALEQQITLLMDNKKVWEQSLGIEKKSIESLRTELHQHELAFDKEKLKKQQLLDNQASDKARLESINNRLHEVKKRLEDIHSPSSNNAQMLDQKLLSYKTVEQELTIKRENAQGIQCKLYEIQQQVKDIAGFSKELNEKIQQNRLEEHALKIKKTSVEESLAEINLNAENVLAFLSNEEKGQDCEKELQETQEKIKRLGAINLIAIDEYQEENERKKILDEQFQDLNEALSTLELAIAKMDEETQSRLRDTFDQINSSFQLLFPRLFGGGRAMLELTCDNLLEAGVLVMAQPPGKRNSTIHMLSGGEKAMTAVALVFAIFQLNPSPFCMLDEVDAPLDDVNVRRFCDLVKEMSEFVQFLFITHNKVTMELADHLIGVTMREPGVSRVVAVDVKQALAIAE